MKARKKSNLITQSPAKDGRDCQATGSRSRSGRRSEVETLPVPIENAFPTRCIQVLPMFLLKGTCSFGNSANLVSMRARVGYNYSSPTPPGMYKVIWTPVNRKPQTSWRPSRGQFGSGGPVLIILGGAPQIWEFAEQQRQLLGKIKMILMCSTDGIHIWIYMSVNLAESCTCWKVWRNMKKSW